MKPVALNVAEEGHGDAVVLAHAIGCDMGMWDDVMPALAAHFRVVRVDVRGHGASPVPERPYSLGQLAGDVVAVLDRLGIERAHWVGLSMGGMIGQAFALAHPRRLRRLVLANTSGGYGPEAHATWAARKKLVREGGMRAIRELAVTRGFSEAFREQHPEIVAAAIAPVMACPVEGYAGCCDAIAALDLMAQLPRIAAPTLAIAGSLDVGTPVEMMRGIAAAIPGARLAVIDGAAHISVVERPLEFARLVRDFLEV